MSLSVFYNFQCTDLSPPWLTLLLKGVEDGRIEGHVAHFIPQTYNTYIHTYIHTYIYIFIWNNYPRIPTKS